MFNSLQVHWMARRTGRRFCKSFYNNAAGSATRLHRACIPRVASRARHRTSFEPDPTMQASPRLPETFTRNAFAPPSQLVRSPRARRLGGARAATLRGGGCTGRRGLERNSSRIFESVPGR